jgi:hypothetical protein
MRARIGNYTVDAWRIEKNSTMPDWVEDAFNDGIIWWNSASSDVLLVNTTGSFFSAFSKKIKFAGIGPAMGTYGWYLLRDPDNRFKVVSEKNFSRDYQVIA